MKFAFFIGLHNVIFHTSCANFSHTSQYGVFGIVWISNPSCPYFVTCFAILSALFIDGFVMFVKPIMVFLNAKSPSRVVAVTLLAPVSRYGLTRQPHDGFFIRVRTFHHATACAVV